MMKIQTFSVRYCLWCLIPGVRRVHHSLEQRAALRKGVDA